ncbi:PepSY-associated TM helix domain-containing protein [Marinicella rhabdoformis]|uniref:PepSY-associated TM helix domain-containing protein n=1 Tax=Marinicella rhabdoformis TaxID=2580566 RepID=UPI0012AECFFD|nr:PepSY-associated TM helix domain-containing protein [Marinicella rhabdoformis]
MTKQSKKRSSWKKLLHTWHWVSSAVSLICLLLFSLTGITLNHADWFESKTTVETGDLNLPKAVVQTIKSNFSDGEVKALPHTLIQWLENQKPNEFNYSKGSFEWDEYEVYFKQPMPGGDKWFVVDIEGAVLSYSVSHRGAIAWLNDLHKGRHTGLVWKWFINVFAVAIFIFSLTGLWLLQIHSKRRPSTWYITASGLLIPALLVYFI